MNGNEGQKQTKDDKDQSCGGKEARFAGKFTFFVSLILLCLMNKAQSACDFPYCK